MSIYHDEVEIEDMEYDEETGMNMNIRCTIASNCDYLDSCV